MSTPDQHVRDGELTGLRGTIRDRQRLIARWLPFTIPGGALVVVGAYLLGVPAPPALPDDGARLPYLARWLLVALLPYAAVFLVILRGRALEGSHNPLLGVESDRLRIHCRIMQNTLEQYLFLAVELFVLATHLPAHALHLVAIAAMVFVVARFLYRKGYLVPDNVLARAPGVQLTSVITIGLMPVCALLVIAAWLGWALPIPAPLMR